MQISTWVEARNYCKQYGKGYDLVVIGDISENEFLQSQIKFKYYGAEFWIGLKRNNQIKEWIDKSKCLSDSTLCSQSFCLGCIKNVQYTSYY